MSQQSLLVVSKPLVERIIEATCLYFGCTEDELKKKNSSQDLVYNRKIAYTLIRENCQLSYARIAARFGFTGHAHVMQYVEETQFRKTKIRQTLNDLDKVLQIANNIDAIIINKQQHGMDTN